MNQQQEQVQSLFKSLDIYYSDEIRIIINRIKYIREELDYITNLSKYSDVYSVVILIEEIKKITRKSFNEALYTCCQEISELLNYIQRISDDVNDFEFSLRNLSSKLFEYQLENEKFFNDRLEMLKQATNIDVFVAVIKKHCNFNKLDFDKEFYLKEWYIKYLSGEIDQELFANNYKSFFLRAKKMIKHSSQDISEQLPLDLNPITDLFKLSYLVNVGAPNIETEYVCHSDSIILSAYSEAYNNTKIAEFNKQVLCNIIQEKIDLKTLLGNNQYLSQIFNYGIFSISQYCSAIDFSQILGINIQESKESSFTSLINQLMSLPNNILTDKEIIYKMNKKDDLYIRYIHNITNSIKSTPREILNNLANLYYSYNIKIATYINSEVNNNRYIRDKFFKVEEIYNKITFFVGKRDKSNLEKYLTEVRDFILELESFYNFCLEQESLISQNLSSSLLISDRILQSYEKKKYTIIVGENNKLIKNDKHIDSRLLLLDELVLANKIESANDIATILIASAFERDYQGTVPILSYNDLPPISHMFAMYIEKHASDSSSISALLELNNNYWNI